MGLNVSKFLDQFFMEAREKLVNIQENMVELENNPNDKEAILSIQRDMHTIKGSSRMVGLKEISKLAHLMEDAFLQFRSGRTTVTAEVMTILYRGVDGVSELLRLAEAKKPLAKTEALANFPELQEDIRRVIDGKVTSSIEEKKQQEKDETQNLKRKFKLDFNVLKKKFKDTVPRIEKVEVDEAGETEEVLSPKPGKPQESPIKDDKPVEMVIQRSPLLEKTHLKVNSDQFETIINQVTDLLSKRYFFNSVLQTAGEFSRLIRGLRREWHDYKSGESRSNTIESALNIDTTVDLFLKKIQAFERDYQVNLGNFEGALRDIYDNLLDMKLTPLSTIFNIYPRFVRDYAYRTDKKIRLFIRGGGTYLDKTVIEKISEPMVHLIRNACDHGIESPEVRLKKGKPPHGTIIIEAEKKGGNVEIKISDDGAGIDKERILQKAVKEKLVELKTAELLDEKEIFDFIFQTGFSTAEQISDTSGRGIGMDIVKRVTRQFGGDVNIESRKDEGTTIRLEFPISIFTSQVTYIREEGVVYAVPCNLIRRIVKLNPAAGDIKEKTDYSVVVYNDEVFTVAKLNQVLTGKAAGIGKEPVFMILPKVTDKKIGIIVDQTMHESEVIIKDLGQFLGKRKYVYGMVIGERGELQTVLDIYDIAASAEFFRKIKIITPVKAGIAEKQSVLVVDDSLLVREMERNFLENAGYEVVTAVNGIDGYNKALTRRFDLIMADIEMPEMDGFEMIENMKRIEGYADVPTVVLSSMEREDDKIRGINLGVNAWLQKQDFDEREMLKLIKRFIG
jgi:two-component system chemotaxis sensor kinase CheA